MKSNVSEKMEVKASDYKTAVPLYEMRQRANNVMAVSIIVVTIVLFATFMYLFR